MNWYNNFPLSRLILIDVYVTDWSPTPAFSKGEIKNLRKEKSTIIFHIILFKEKQYL